MKICIVSDSHDRADALARAVHEAKAQGAEAVIHCGDLIGAQTIKPALACADLPFLERVAERPGFSFAADRLPEPLFAPALILAGRQDSACGYRDAWPLLEGMPRATYVVLDRAGHDLEDVQAGLFEALTAEWLDRVEEYSRRASPPQVASGDKLAGG